MPDLHYMELNLMQIFDVLRKAEWTRLAVTLEDQPYLLPLHYQLEVSQGETLIHIVIPDHGRLADILRVSGLVCLEMELAGCAWLDTVLLEGLARVHPHEELEVLGISILVTEMTGRRFFQPTS